MLSALTGDKHMGKKKKVVNFVNFLQTGTLVPNMLRNVNSNCYSSSNCHTVLKLVRKISGIRMKSFVVALNSSLKNSVCTLPTSQLHTSHCQMYTLCEKSHYFGPWNK